MSGPNCLPRARIRLLVWLLACSPLTNAALLEEVRTGTNDERTRVVFDIDTAVTYRAFSLSDPERVVIDFEDSSVARSTSLRFPDTKDAPITGLRYSTRGDRNLRVVLDLSRKVDLEAMQLESGGKYGNRVVVDLYVATATRGRQTTSNVVSETVRQTDRLAPQTRTTSQIPASNPIAPALVDRPSEVATTDPSKADPAGAVLRAKSNPNSENSWGSALISKIDEKMATFNPIGKYFRKPIERAIPRFEISGFMRQSSDMLIAESGTVGFRQQDYRFLQLQNLFELEANYHVTDGIDVRAVGHSLYDGVYDWQDSKGLFADSTNRTAELYHSGERVLRELFVSYRKLGFDLKLGKQQIAWGKMDGQFIDLINGMDRRESVQLETSDFETRRLPTWMLNSTFFFGSTTVQTLYIFDFEHDRQPELGSPWASPLVSPTTTNIVLKPIRPKHNVFRDHEYAIRVDRTYGALTYGAMYMYGWDKNPVDRVIGTALNEGERVLRIQPRHERLHHFGITADYAMTFENVPFVGSLPTVFRVESLYTNGVRFSDSQKRTLALSGRTDGTSKRDTIRAAIAIEFALPHRTTLLFQPSWYQTINYTPTLGAGFGGGFGAKWTLIPVVFFARPFAFSGDRLSLDITALPTISGSGVGWGGLKTKTRLSYDLSQFVKARMIYTGYDLADSADVYGAYGRWDNLGWELSYEF
ncbi:MAG: hypothetical protein ACI9BW_002231 [Gammaproteobacteria bacterium]|jgi:hypothetical protein